jgi:hypothetical protein
MEIALHVFGILSHFCIATPAGSARVMVSSRNRIAMVAELVTAHLMFLSVRLRLADS